MKENDVGSEEGRKEGRTEEKLFLCRLFCFCLSHTKCVLFLFEVSGYQIIR